MKRICKFSFIHVMSLGFLLTITNSCTTEVDPKLLPVLTTTEASSITNNSASCGGNITTDAGLSVTVRGVCWSTKTNPTIKESKTNDGAGTGSFTSEITGLNANTTYFVRAYATSSAGTGYGAIYSFTTPLLITFNSNLTYGSVNDIDGNKYKTITIGTQTWMAENLRTTKYRDGVAIPNVTDNRVWASLTTDAWCNYNNDASNALKYGKLYNWYAATNSHNIAPMGWHVPTVAEWTTLTTFLGGESVSGGKLKETGTGNWRSPNAGATNESGFSALAGGYRFNNGNGEFDLEGINGIWWSSTQYYTNNAWYVGMYFNSINVFKDKNLKANGFSVRCVKD
jgi:uncharacterized protein (TIGR02145 family)